MMSENKAPGLCKGGCHCGRVEYEIELPDHLTVHRCNCSICQKSGYLHYIIPATQFTLLKGREHLTEYRFHTGVARHLFCSHCGVKSFYVPRSHPEGVSVNVNCLDPGTISSLEITAFEGASWEENIHNLSPLND